MTSSSESTTQPPVPVSWYRRFPPKAVLGTLGLLAACDLGFYLLAVRPAALEERDRIARNARLEMEVLATRKGVAAVREAADRIDAADEKGKALVQEIALPRRSAFSALLAELGSACLEAGVEIRESNYSVEPIEGSDGYGILAVNANFRGRYEQLVRLLFRLDRSELFFIIGSLGATPREDGSPGELQINMRFDTFVRGI